TFIASHELAEAATDTDIGLDTSTTLYQYPAAWGDNNCGEIGDICASGATGDTITVNGHNWVVQQLWSNAANKCQSSGTIKPVCPGTTINTTCRKCSCGDTGNACNGNTSVCGTTGGNVLFGGCEQCTSSDNTCAGGGGTCQQSTTPSMDDIC